MFECNDCSVMLLEGSMHVCRSAGVKPYIWSAGVRSYIRRTSQDDLVRDGPPKPAAYDFAERLVEELDNLIEVGGHGSWGGLDIEAAAKLIRERCIAAKPRRERKYVQFFERDDE